VNIIQFPTPPTDNAAAITRNIRAGMAGNGVSLPDIETIVANMAEFIAILGSNPGFTFSARLADSEAAAAFQRQVGELHAFSSSLTGALIQERVKAELHELYRGRLPVD